MIPILTGELPIHGKPRTTDLRPWLWGATLTGRSEHSSRTIVVGVGIEIVRGSSLHLRTGRSVVRGKSSSLAKPDAHQGVFHVRNKFGSGLTVH